MKKLRILARTLVVDDDKILLVKNKGANFWYPPGGGWEYESETIIECAAREVEEETGYKVDIDKLLWVQEFHEGDKILFETFWLSRISEINTQTADQLKHHVDIDPDGAVEEVRWFAQEDIQNLKVFPERVKFYNALIAEQDNKTNPFIGTFL